MDSYVMVREQWTGTLWGENNGQVRYGERTMDRYVMVREQWTGTLW